MSSALRFFRLAPSSRLAQTCRLAVLGVLVLGTVLGCAEERPPINKVQPYALDKSLFVGKDLVDPKDDPEFYYHATLIDVGYGAAQDGLFTSTYAQPVARIRWEITKDHLVGRLAYERLQGSDGKGAGKAVKDGVIVAVFKIESHFDVRRSYNPTTGEETNVLEENSSDRPWYQRSQFRVDWSKNLNTDSYDFDMLSLLGIYGGITYESLALPVEDPNDENAPYFQKDGNYFDVTTKAFAKPGVIDLSHLGWGIDSFPACFLDADFSGGSAPSGSCNPIEITIRHSFKRVENTDFEAADWDGWRFQAYGAFTTDRQGYARNYGMSDAKWHRFISRYNIWERAHYYSNPEKMTGAIECFTPKTTPFGADPHRDLKGKTVDGADGKPKEVGDGTEDECAAAGKGSRCDTFAQKCTLPFQDRKARPVIWYYTDGSHPEYFDPTEDATHEWDVALRAAVRSSQQAECKLIGGSVEDCEKKFAVWKGQQDDNQDAIDLTREVDDCRHGIAYKELGRDEAKCAALADKIGKERGYADGVIAVAKMQEMVVLCHSPVQADDPAVCGMPRLPKGVSAKDCFDARLAGNDAILATCRDALHVRPGDLRYHQVNVVVAPQTPSPWGIYTDSHDPLTGETLSASINVWSHVTDLWSQGIVDTARYIAGELRTEQITNGKYIKDWSEAAQAAAGDGILPRLTEKQVSERMEAATGREMDAEKAKEFEHKHPEAVTKIHAVREKLQAVTASSQAPSTNAPLIAARRHAAAGTPFEAKLMTPMMQMLAGIQGMPFTDGLMEMFSPLRGGNPTMLRELRRMKENALAERGACIMHGHEAAAPLSIAALTDVLQQKFGTFDNPEDLAKLALEDPDKAAARLAEQPVRAEKMRKYVAKRAHYAVIIHEMGHSLGLRHNFISSSDAWGYRPQYWQLRTSDGKVSKNCTALSKTGEDCVGPRWFDPVTETERNNLIWMWMHSSVMDYAGEATQDLLGLGAYDFAAVRMFYGDTVAVHADETYNAGTNRGRGMLAKMDSFGGILGLQPRFGTKDIHYTELHKQYELIRDCAPVDTQKYVPARWNAAADGAWHPLVDGLMVKVGEQHTRCKQQQVDYVPWRSLRNPVAKELSGYYRGGPAIDSNNRIRMPYGFATDRWADLGNASVYRHDNGADTYEIFNFLITQQEVGHIFDNYRRGRTSFSVRGAANRTLERYNEKLRDGAKGLGLYRNIYRDVALEAGIDADELWSYAATTFFPQNVLASGMVFDHFTRTAQRPQEGPHFLDEGGVLRSEDSKMSNAQTTNLVAVPNGATGYYGQITYGGRPVENRLSDDKGEYDSEYTMNAGSYYDKMYSSMLMTESVDNFISSSLGDFTDARYRAVSLADLFPEGYRRWLSSNLTGDETLKGARVAADSKGKPVVDGALYPTVPIGWTSWWGKTPSHCFPAQGTTICRSPGSSTNLEFGGLVPDKDVPVDSQVGWEQQKFLIAWTLLYLPENQQQGWLDMLRMWELGVDSDPTFPNRIELHAPTGKIYVARTYGKETIFDKTVQKGIAARVLEYANDLMAQAYETTDGPDLDGDGKADWYLPVLDKTTGMARVKYDTGVEASKTCGPDDNSGCLCTGNRACMKLQAYLELPFYMREAIDAYSLGLPKKKGVY